jgi:transposase
MIELKTCLENVNRLRTDQTARLKNRESFERERREENRQVPGLAEIADPRSFQNDKQVASWSALVPSSWYTTGKNPKTGHITKKGDKWIRRVPSSLTVLAIPRT